MKKLLAVLVAFAAMAALAAPCTAAGLCTHEFDDGVVERDPTCVQNGVMLYTCKLCGRTKRESIPATGHNLGEYELYESATCNACGSLRSACQNPGCVYAVYKSTRRLGHKLMPETVLSEPDCTNYGYTVYTCTHEGCSASETIAFPPLGHWYDEGTVGEDGQTVWTCRRCGAQTNKQP